jgi:phage terminase large subunit
MPPSLSDIAPSTVANVLAHWRKKPEEFVIDVLGSKPWDMQIEITRSAFNYKYTAVKTCNAIGKSYIAARIVVTYLMLYPDSTVVTTAPTWRQVTDVLWREIGSTVKKAEQRGFKLTKKEVAQAKLDLDTDWFAVGLSTSRPENFFGYHADDILVVVDEAGGVDESVFKGVAAITPNSGAHVLLIGNPTNPTGTFFDAFTKPELGYNCFTIGAFDTPNFTMVGITTVEKLLQIFTPPPGIEQAEWTKKVNAELEPKMDPVYRKSLIAPSVVFGRYHEWGGVDNPLWQSLIMGQFPSQASQSLIPMDIIRTAMRFSDIDPNDDLGRTFGEIASWNVPNGPDRYGQDMARFGNDRNILTPRHGGWVRKQIAWNKVDLMTSADNIVDIIDIDDPTVRVNIDDTGNGGGTTDRIHQKSRERIEKGGIGYQFRLTPYNMSSKERMANVLRFHDVTSEIYWNLRIWFIRKAIAFEEFDQELYDELVDRRWFVNKSGKIQVESKDDFRERTKSLRSPDKSDSLALSFAGETPEGVYHDVKTKQDEYYEAREREASPLPAQVPEPVMADLDERH